MRGPQVSPPGILAETVAPLHLTVAAERALWSRKRAVVLTAGLLLAAAIGVSVGATALRLVPVRTSGDSDQITIGTLSRGEIDAYDQAEVDPFAGFALPDPKLVAEQARAEGGYHGRNLFPPNSHQRHGH